MGKSGKVLYKESAIPRLITIVLVFVAFASALLWEMVIAAKAYSVPFSAWLVMLITLGVIYFLIRSLANLYSVQITEDEVVKRNIFKRPSRYSVNSIKSWSLEKIGNTFSLKIKFESESIDLDSKNERTLRNVTSFLNERYSDRSLKPIPSGRTIPVSLIAGIVVLIIWLICFLTMRPSADIISGTVQLEGRLSDKPEVLSGRSGGAYGIVIYLQKYPDAKFEYDRLLNVYEISDSAHAGDNVVLTVDKNEMQRINRKIYWELFFNSRHVIHGYGLQVRNRKYLNVQEYEKSENGAFKWMNLTLLPLSIVLLMFGFLKRRKT